MKKLSREEKIEALTIHNDEKIHGFFKEFRFLSNMWPCSVNYKNVDWPSSENAYQVMKFIDLTIWHRITEMSPTASKSEANRLTWSADTDPRAIRDNWIDIKVDEMKAIVKAKFSQNEDLKAKLLATGDRILEEGNYWHDTFWGICEGVGLNMLGRILMEVRKELEND